MMRRIDGEKFGRWSLRLDAAYCVLLGLGVAVFSGKIAEGVAFSPVLIAAAGIVVVVWAGGILWMLARLSLRLVMVANLLAAVAVAFASAAAATLLVVAAVVTVAVDIALFATSQAIALRALPARG